jgi:hypothetical protein
MIGMSYDYDAVVNTDNQVVIKEKAQRELVIPSIDDEQKPRGVRWLK